MEKPRYKITVENVETALQFYCIGKGYAHSSRATIEKLVEQAKTCHELQFIDDIETLLESQLPCVHKAITASSNPLTGGYPWSDGSTSQANVLDFILAAKVPSWKLMRNITKARKIVEYIQQYKHKI